MQYNVTLTEIALAEAQEYSEFIRHKSNDSAASDHWWNGLLSALTTLESLPARCAAAPEQIDLNIPLHQLLYQSHRIVFQIHSGHVEVLRICHTSQRPLTAAALRKAPPRKKPS